MEKINQDTLIQLHEHNVARQKIIDEQNQKLDRILELTHILTSKVLPKYNINEVPKKEIITFVSALHQTIIGKQNGKE